MPTAVAPLSKQARIESGQLLQGFSSASKVLGQQTVGSLRRFFEYSQAVPDFYHLTGIPVALDLDNVLLSYVTETLEPTRARIERLRTWQDGWNGYDALAPDKGALAHAQRWIESMLWVTLAVRLPWSDPNVTGSLDGEVVFEWWYGKRKLTVYVSAQDAEYVQVWGPNIHSQMAEGIVHSPEDFQEVWRWLTAGE